MGQPPSVSPAVIGKIGASREGELRLPFLG
jgi:hypothetical protein